MHKNFNSHAISSHIFLSQVFFFFLIVWFKLSRRKIKQLKRLAKI